MDVLRYCMLLSVIMLNACSLFGGDSESPEPAPAAEPSRTTSRAPLTEQGIYEAAQEAFRINNFVGAIEQLQLLETRFPFGRYAEQAQLELIYAYYENFEPELARSSAERFIRLNPDHPNVDYAYYLKGLSSFIQEKTFFQRFFPSDPTKRDIGTARVAFDEFKELLTRFPNSPYTADARKRMVYVRNNLAAYEVNVAKYYIKREAYVAAANRAKSVVQGFQRTPAVPDALAIMVECYLKIGLPDLADSALQVLVSNYPDHPSIDEDGQFLVPEDRSNRNRSLVNIASFGLLDRGPAPRIFKVSRPSLNSPLPPNTSFEATVVETAEEAPERKRSLLNIITFGLLGDSGEEQQEADQE